MCRNGACINSPEQSLRRRSPHRSVISSPFVRPKLAKAPHNPLYPFAARSLANAVLKPLYAALALVKW